MAGLPRKYFKKFPGDLKKAWAEYKKDKNKKGKNKVAKKKKKTVKKRTVKKRTIKKNVKRKVSKVKKINIISKLASVGYGVGGAVVANTGANMIPVQDPRVKAIIPLLGGLFLMTNKSKVLKEVGLGMAIGGGLSTLKAVAPNIPLLAGEEIPNYNNLELPADIEQALISGEISPEEAEILQEATGETLGVPMEFMGEPLELAGDDWQDENYFEMS